ncbi:MAG: hypothetical protein K6G40_07440 [Eubacterium sp.]|nr:hypothetical protein [Eubacterium sp.]
MKKQTMTLCVVGVLVVALIIAAAFYGKSYVSTVKEDESAAESGDVIAEFDKDANSYFNKIGVEESIELGETYELKTGAYSENNTDEWTEVTLEYQVIDCSVNTYDSLYNEVQLTMAIYMPLELYNDSIAPVWNIGMVDRYSGLEIPTDGTHIKLEDGSVIYGSVSYESGYDEENYIYYVVYDMMIPNDYMGMDFFIGSWNASDTALQESDDFPSIGEILIDDYASFSNSNFGFYKISEEDMYRGSI